MRWARFRLVRTTQDHINDVGETTMSITKHRRTIALAGISAVMLVSCGSSKSSTTAATTAAGAVTTAAGATTAAPATTAAAPATTAAGAAATTVAAAGGMDKLVADCKKEGKVNLIALPDDWANYKGILEAFRTKYAGVQNPVASPDISSQEELDAIKNLKGQPDMPDNIDVSPAKALAATTDGLWEPFKPSTYDQIPTSLKDPAGNWVGAYYGIISFGSNLGLVKNAPTSFADLKKPEYKGQVSISNDPRKSGEAFSAVMAASLANGGSFDDIMPGIKFFAELKKSGNFNATNFTKPTTLSGETPINITWSYNVPGIIPELEKANIKYAVTYPSDSVYAGYYAQGVVKGSPHQACAKLWVEHILSDEGALGYLKGGAIPARYAELVKANKIDDASKKNLPPAEKLASVKFMNDAQSAKAQKDLEANWGPMVADA
jgi:putative spermidine/putrescine transport system substrate-binding protein